MFEKYFNKLDYKKLTDGTIECKITFFDGSTEVTTDFDRRKWALEKIFSQDTTMIARKS